MIVKLISINSDTGERVYSRKEGATICDVSIQTIALWEKKGQIPPTSRDDNDYRYWTEKDLEELKKYAEEFKFYRGKRKK